MNSAHTGAIQMMLLAFGKGRNQQSPFSSGRSVLPSRSGQRAPRHRRLQDASAGHVPCERVSWQSTALHPEVSLRRN